MKTVEELIANHPFLEGLDDADLALMAGCARNVVFERGAFLIREGCGADQFFLIRKGTVALESYAPGQEPLVFFTVKDNDFLGLSWLTPPYRWQFDARALEPVRALSFDAVCLRGKCDENPELGFELMKRFVPALMRRLRAARLQMMDLYGCRPVGGAGESAS